MFGVFFRDLVCFVVCLVCNPGDLSCDFLFVFFLKEKVFDLRFLVMFLRFCL